MSEGTLISAGCDWITGVATEIKSAWALAILGSEMITTQMARGNMRRGWGMSGFSGWQCGPVQLGKRGDECMLRLSADAALLSWREVYKRADHITRLDLQITHIDDREPRKRIRAHWRQAMRWTRGKAKSPAVTLITGSDGADTLYLGKRQSARFGRVYAAGIQKKWDANRRAIRYECELKDQQAMLHARAIAAKGKDVSPAIEYTAAFFRNRGLSLPSGLEATPLISDPPSVTDLHTRLSWIRNAVRPSCHLLISSGMDQELLEALDLVIENGRLINRGP